MEKLIAWFEEQRGRRLALAQHLAMAPSAVSQWRRVPAERVQAVEKYTGIPRCDLRPDLYAEAA